MAGGVSAQGSAFTARRAPLGYASSCLNVVFADGRVETRGGITSGGQLSPANPVVSASEYPHLDGTIELIGLNTSGDLFTGITLIDDTMVEASLQATQKHNATTLFGRHFIGIAANGISGASAPRFYDGTSLYRVSQVGPGGAPTVADGAAGNIEVGNHSFRVFFKTKHGYWTAPGPAVTLAADGSKKADLAAIPVGPTNVVARVIAATPTDDDSNYYFIEGSTMVINDNTTTTATVDFTDAQLIAGTAVSILDDPDGDMLNLIELAPQAGPVAYNGRLGWWGERSTIPLVGDIGFRNLSFDGGFASGIPLGWTSKIAGVTQGTGLTGAVNDYIKITGNGGGTQAGLIENNSNASEVIPPGVDIRARIRARKTSGAAAGTVHLYFALAATANGTRPFGNGMSIDVSELSSSEWRVIDGEVLTTANNATTPDWRLRLSGGGAFGTAITSTEGVFIDYIELYEEGKENNPALVRWSRVDDPESYDALTGFMFVGPDDGQRIVTAFQLRGNLYFVKQHSIYTTYDTGASEPAFWPVESVSSQIGAVSDKGVALGDGWAVIAAYSGLYLFAGGVPVKVSDLIQPLWDEYVPAALDLWVACDTDVQRVYIGVRTTLTNQIFVCDYSGKHAPDNDCDWSIFTSDTRFGIVARNAFTLGRYLTVGNSTGKYGILENSIGSLDFGSGFVSHYRTGYIDPGPERDLVGALGMDAGGEDPFTVKLYDKTGAAANAVTLATVAINDTNPATDLEWSTRFVKERVAVEVSAAAGDYFTMNSLTLWTRPKPDAPNRGSRT